MTKNIARDPNKVYFERMIMMAMLLVPAAFLQGIRAVFVCVLSVLCSMITDAVCCLIRRIRYNVKDAAVPFWGLAAGMMMPVSVPVGLVHCRRQAPFRRFGQHNLLSSRDFNGFSHNLLSHGDALCAEIWRNIPHFWGI